MRFKFASRCTFFLSEIDEEAGDDYAEPSPTGLAGKKGKKRKAKETGSVEKKPKKAKKKKNKKHDDLTDVAEGDAVSNKTYWSRGGS